MLIVKLKLKKIHNIKIKIIYLKLNMTKAQLNQGGPFLKTCETGYTRWDI